MSGRVIRAYVWRESLERKGCREGEGRCESLDGGEGAEDEDSSGEQCKRQRHCVSSAVAECLR